MAPEDSRKGLWGRVKGALGAPDDEGDDLASRPQITSTFTASRLPTADGSSMPGRLFPSARGKWELYEDAWDEAEEPRNPELGPPDAWQPGGEPDADEAPTAHAPAPPATPAPFDVRPPAMPRPVMEPTDEAPPAPPTPSHPEAPRSAPTSSPSAAASDAPIAFFSTARPSRPAEPSADAPAGDDPDLSETLASLASDGEAGLLEHLDTENVDELARVLGVEVPPKPEPPAPPPPEPPAPVSRPPLAARDPAPDAPTPHATAPRVDALAPDAPPHATPVPPPMEPDVPATLMQPGDIQQALAEAVAEAEGGATPEAPAPAPVAETPAASAATPEAGAPAVAEPAWKPQPDIEAVRPHAEGRLFAEAPHEVRDRLLSASSTSMTPRSEPPPPTLDDAEIVRPPGPIQRDIGAERRIAVHEQRLEQAIARARQSAAPEVQVYDDRLDEPAAPKPMNPSEAMALAERGRDAIGPRSDVAPAS